jgi:hypothetical protein
MCERNNTSKRFDVMSLQQMVSGPPVQDFIAEADGVIHEEQTEVGWIDADQNKGEKLAEYGVCMRFAEWDPETERWERCLFSESVADLLVELHGEGDFPFQFESGPSQAQADWLERQARGETRRDVLPLWQYAVPASAETLAALASRATLASTGGSRKVLLFPVPRRNQEDR